MEFSLGSDDFAIPLLNVKEVIALPKLRPFPNAPSHFLGIMNLRGLVLAIIDLRKKLNIDPRPNSQETAVVILDLKGIYLGVVVDSVNTVFTVTQSSISPAPPMGSVDSEYVLGVHKDKDKMTLLLDLSKALNLKDFEAIRASQQHVA